MISRQRVDQWIIQYRNERWTAGIVKQIRNKWSYPLFYKTEAIVD